MYASNKLGESHCKVGEILGFKARSLRELNSYEEAIEAELLSLENKKKFYDSYSGSIAITLRRIGKTYINLNRPDKAKEYLQQARNMQVAAYKTESCGPVRIIDELLTKITT